jgi:hypothetical protein
MFYKIIDLHPFTMSGYDYTGDCLWRFDGRTWWYLPPGEDGSCPTKWQDYDPEDAPLKEAFDLLLDLARNAGLKPATHNPAPPAVPAEVCECGHDADKHPRGRECCHFDGSDTRWCHCKRFRPAPAKEVG